MATIGAVAAPESVEDRLIQPARVIGRPYWILIGVLTIVIAWGVFAYLYQVRNGLIVTGMRDRISWGLYVALFEFFLGVGMAGTFMSAVLRVTHARWRGPVTRAAEIMTVSALVVAGIFILIDVGRPDRVIQNLVLFGRWESPLMWDVFGVATYLAGSALYLFLDSIPDLGLLRDRISSAVALPRRSIFGLASLGWEARPEQRKSLSSALDFMSVVMIPVATMMVAVASWVFSMTLREPWNSSMFGIYFVGGASYSGIGLLILILAGIRRIYHLEAYITFRHFRNLAFMLVTFAAVMIFFNVSEFVTTGYKLSSNSTFFLNQMVHGDMAVIFWVYMWAGLVLPIVIVAIPATRNFAGILVASIAANVGMFLERYFLVIGGLRVPLNPYPAASYSPTWVEWSLMVAGAAIFVLIIVVVMKLVPPISVWEMRAIQGARPAAESGAASEEASS